MNEELITKLEAKIYAFSVNVYSFVKSLIEAKLSNTDTKELLNAANSMYSSYLDKMEEIDKGGKSVDFTDCVKHAQICMERFQNINLTGALLNEKVDLNIEIHEIIQKLKTIS